MDGILHLIQIVGLAWWIACFVTVLDELLTELIVATKKGDGER